MSATASPPAGARVSDAAQRLARVKSIPPATLAAGFLTAATVIWAILTPAFLTTGDLKSIGQNAALVGIVAVTMTPMAISGNFVSLGTQQITVAGEMMFVLLVGHGSPIVLAIVVAVLLLVAIGVLQGLIVAAGLNPVITTLAAGLITFGVIDQIDSSGAPVTVGNHAIGWGTATVAGIPIHVFVFAIVTVVLWVYMSKTTVGRRINLIGANRATARLSGLSFTRVTIGVFVLASVGMAIAGILGGAQFQVAGTSDFSTITIDAIAAIVVGGTPLAGGLGSPVRSAFGAVIISAIEGLMRLNGFSPGLTQIVEGGIVVVVVCLVEIGRRRRRLV